MNHPSISHTIDIDGLFFWAPAEATQNRHIAKVKAVSTKVTATNIHM